MQLKHLVVCGMVLTAGCSVAVHREEPKQSDEQIRAELMQIERDIGTANVKRDKAYFEKIEAAEFIFTGAGGSLTTKAEDLAGLDAPPGDWAVAAYDPDEMKVYVYGNTAVVFGRTTTHMHNTKTGEDRTSLSRFTDTFVRRNGGWVLVAGHSSAIRGK